MDWLSDLQKIVRQEKKIETLKEDKFTGHIEEHFHEGKLQKVKIIKEVKAE